MTFVDVDKMLLGTVYSILIQWSNWLTLSIWQDKTDTFNKVIIKTALTK